jgi:hypothetical protein
MRLSSRAKHVSHVSQETTKSPSGSMTTDSSDDTTDAIQVVSSYPVLTPTPSVESQDPDESHESQDPDESHESHESHESDSSNESDGCVEHVEKGFTKKTAPNMSQKTTVSDEEYETTSEESKSSCTGSDADEDKLCKKVTHSDTTKALRKFVRTGKRPRSPDTC